jgi:hypothetical protein
MDLVQVGQGMPAIDPGPGLQATAIQAQNQRICHQVPSATVGT